ncbi:PREDICTED: uncharacterized protein LOC104729248 [Camelina sativa]|uniref:Uncharacterized protein LOC104729248 n=1 Tax=Camelina sativa TaxID=90675 RepID=A0ABM0UUB0_CAMSA|nr:PREDICTED: uncharacterized protein LOC104729248 [Camelina sativa]
MGNLITEGTHKSLFFFFYIKDDKTKPYEKKQNTEDTRKRDQRVVKTQKGDKINSIDRGSNYSINQMEEIGFSGDSSSEIAISETEMEAAKQLVQLSEDDSLSCSSGTGWSVSGHDACEGKAEGGHNTKRQDEVVVSSKVRDHFVGNELNDGVRGNKSFMKTIMETKTRINKKQKYRSIASIYRATKEMTREAS